jgi:hypothetical protein
MCEVVAVSLTFSVLAGASHQTGSVAALASNKLLMRSLMKLLGQALDMVKCNRGYCMFRTPAGLL